MTTARNIIKDALRKIQILGKGSSLDASEADDALQTLNDMLATWSAEGDMIFTETKETFSLSSSESHTIGAGADFDTTRPLYISAAFVSQGDIDYSLEEIDNQSYASITQKDLGNIPEVFYYDAGYPTATIYLYPKPTSVSSITLYSFKPLSTFSDLDTVFAMPAEYRTALVHNLAVWIAPEYEREASPTIQRIAADAKDAVMAQNKRNEMFLSPIDIPTRRQMLNNIYEGYYT